jgi:hypothetical protein
LNISDTKELSFTENESTIEFTVQLGPGSGALIKLSDEVSVVETLPIAETIKLFPNPAEKRIQIQTENIQLLKYSIYNTMGSLIIENTQLQNESINIEFLKPGIYVLKMDTDKGVLNKKFVKR